MKLQNKKTLKVVDVEIKSAFYEKIVKIKLIDKVTGTTIGLYTSLAELNEYWQDYEEPKSYWYINDLTGTPFQAKPNFCIVDEFAEWSKDRKAIGNYFETEEEATKASEKVKAWKRLRDKGFKFDRYYQTDNYGDLVIETNVYENNVIEEIRADLDLLFGGEE